LPTSSSTAIRVVELGKRYRIGAARAQYRTFREVITNAAKAPLRRLFGSANDRPAPDREFWALRGVSFTVAPGDVVGVIGRNGAGKSTLLKILSRITEPTEGRAEIHGRVGSLLEVGTGFHPELTGRENVYLNGAILGMRRAEIQRNFDEIVAFAEVEQFIDTVVKHYSSGMYLRLAFAVAAYLEPEILLVDEVLAVGDAVFQKKCLGKMDEVARQGRTVFFVSHNLEAVRSLCTRGILLDAGKVKVDGTTSDALSAYRAAIRASESISQLGLQDRLARTTGAARFTSITVTDEDGEVTERFEAGQSMRVRMCVEAFADVPSLGVLFALKSGTTRDYITVCKHTVADRVVTAGESLAFAIDLPNPPLQPGDYSLYIGLGDAVCARFYDVVDENVNLPWVHVWSDESDGHKRLGYFQTPSRLVFE